MSLSPETLKKRLDATDYAKLMAVAVPRVHEFVADAIELCQPDRIAILDDSAESMAVTRRRAIEAREEARLAIEGHTIHYDGPEDQGRDREVTKYLVPADQTLSKSLNQTERETGLTEIRGLLKGVMKGRTLIVRFLTLGPNNSVFSIPCVECTDSWYVSHALNLLYRPGYEDFKRAKASTEFFATLHSSGKVNERMVSAEADKKRIYIDYTTNTVYSVNTQYAGNTVGLKKLALRLTIRKADREGWLAEHMFLMGVKGRGGRKTYLAGAFPSACGKTSTAMLPGETILGDDIAYFRAVNGEFRAVNAEAGIFGIIQNVSAKDDPVIWDALTKPGEVIFSNLLVKAGKPYWLGMGCDTPADGENFSGAWHKGKKDAQGAEIPLAHKNARYAVALNALANCDAELENPAGVVLGGIIYGGRDARSYVPVQEGFDWEHGIVAYGASLETETTFAILGKEGVSEINLMSIQDFVAIPLGKYVANNLMFAKKIAKTPKVFGVNYFLRDKEGKFVNGVRDKHVWVKWMELRIHGEAGAIRAPTGLIPLYKDLVPLFRQVLGKEYRTEDYAAQFTIRVPENLAKLDRVETFHREHVPDAPSVLFDVLKAQRARLLDAKARYGDYISPDMMPQETAP
jgi:phosphoenolpyruvate carboxykinase (GTP)